MKHHLSELWTDPSSGEYSASRLSLLALVGAVISLIALDLYGLKFSAWSSLALIIGSVAGIYGINSGIRVWHGRILKKDE